MTATFVIVGAGHAGGRAAQALRREGFTDRLVLIGAEAHLPYEWPPLSKGVLTGAQTPDACRLVDPNFYEEHGIVVRTGARALGLDPAAHSLTLESGETLRYDQLLLCTGGRYRRLSIAGEDLPGVHYLRTLDDALRIRQALSGEYPIVVIGGGFIGLEVAASARACGCEVVVVEAAPRLMARVVPRDLADEVARVHRDRGVTLMTDTRPVRISGAGRALTVELEGGDGLRAGAVVIGVGIMPSTELAELAGLHVDNGIVVDACLRTSDPDIFAAGDAANAFHPVFERRIRLESWQNAQSQPVAAARNMLGSGEPHGEIPWLWSDQYDLNLQVAGLTDNYTEIVRRGTLADGGVVHFLLRGGRMVGACGLGHGGAIGRDIRVAQMLIAGAGPVPASDLADPAVKLKGLLKPR